MTRTAKPQARVFKRGSTTYFNSSFFFPRAIRKAVYVLYAFVRRADDFVDELPQDKEGFDAFIAYYRQSREGLTPESGLIGGLSKDDRLIIEDFIQLERDKGFDPAWTEAFLRSMEMDLYKKTYESLDETLEYIYGSAEVIGLFMARILGLPEASYPAARSLGRAMQYINFIRDIQEDNSLGRRYLPLTGSSLTSLDEDQVRAHPDAFIHFHRNQIGIYKTWDEEARKGFGYIPFRCRIAIMTASDMYLWTASVIEKDPFCVYERKVKPSRKRIIFRAFRNIFRALCIRKPR